MSISHVSASQIKLYTRCPRRWYYQYIEKLPTPPPSKALAYGSLIHEQIEGQIQGSNTPDRDLIAEPLHLYKQAIPYLQHLWRLYHAGWLLVEEEIRIETPSGVPIIGRADVVSVGRVVDHKTTSDKKYILKPEELAQDLQANVYVYWYHQQHLQKLFGLDEDYKQKETTVFVHHYLNKKDSRASRVETPMPRAENKKYVEEKVFPTVQKIVDAACLDHSNVLFNKKDCWSYGQRCPFFDRCQKGQSKEEALRMNESLREKLNRIKKQNAEAAAQTKTLEGVVEHYDSTGETVGLNDLSHDDKLVFSQYRKDKEQADADSRELAEIAAISPPDQAEDHLPGQYLDGNGNPISEFEHYKVSSKLIKALHAAGVASFKSASALPDKYFNNLVLTRGNGIGKGKVDAFRALVADKVPKKSEVDPFKDDEFVQLTKDLYEEPAQPETVVEIKEPVKPKPKREVKRKPKKEEKAPKGFSLFINCDFMRTNGYEDRVIRLENVVQILSQVVQDEQDVPHWSLSPYATGAGHLAALLKEQIADGTFDRKIIIANSFFPASSALLEVLMPEAHTIVGALK